MLLCLVVSLVLAVFLPLSVEMSALSPIGHFDLYPGTTPAYDESLEAMKKFLLDRVPPTRSS